MSESSHAERCPLCGKLIELSDEVAHMPGPPFHAACVAKFRTEGRRRWDDYRRRNRWRFVLLVIPIAVATLVLIPPMAVATTVNDWRLRRAFRARYGRDDGRVVIGYRPDTAWHRAIVARWIPAHGDRTILLDETADGFWTSRSIEARTYRRWKPDHKMVQPPAMIAIPARGRVSTISFASVLGDAERGEWAPFEERAREVARLAGL